MKPFNLGVGTGLISGGLQLHDPEETGYFSHEVSIHLFPSVGNRTNRRPIAAYYTRATVAASLFGRGKASAHFVKGHIHVRIYVEPRRVRGCGPVRSKWIFFHRRTGLKWLQIRLTRRLPTMVRLTLFTSLYPASCIGAPMRPIRSPLYLIQGLSDTQVSPGKSGVYLTEKIFSTGCGD